jgi:hypothetical protein
MQAASRKARSNSGTGCFFDRNKAVYGSLEERFNTLAGSARLAWNKTAAETKY